MSNPRYGSGRNQFIGRGVAVDLTKLDAATYEGAVVYSENQIYFSDGSNWTIPQDTVDIARPAGVPPLTIEQQAQLTLSPFVSPTGETQIGIVFEWNADGIADFSVGANVETRTVTSTTANIYDILYPEDGFAPGDVIWWRAKYLGTNGTQSQFSTPIAQFYPPLLSDPEPVTRVGAITGEVEITPFFSLFGLQYVQTEFQFWNEGDDPEVDPPLLEVTTQLGTTLTLPEELAEGGNYLWRARYGANLIGVGSPTAFTNYTVARVVNKGAGSMVLIYDPALANNRTITLPLGIYGGVVSVTVDWGDGNEETFTTSGYKNHTYAPEVTELVTVVISGQLEQYGGNANIQGLVRVENIGFQLGLTSLREMFRNVTSNTTVVTPNLPPQVIDATGMFQSGDIAFDITNLDVSNIQIFSNMFNNAVTFNQDISEWDTSSAITMDGMFYASANGVAYAFNQDIGGWDVSSVTNMSGMFGRLSNATPHAFNQDIGGWDISSVTNMAYMFGAAAATGGYAYHEFNNGGSPSIANWDVSNVTNMEGMFSTNQFASSAATQQFTKFNQSLAAWGDKIANVTNAKFMFRGSNYTASLAGWSFNPSADINGFFARAQFNGDVTGWRPPTSIANVFSSARFFNNASITTWDVSGVTNMSNLFVDAIAFNQNIGNWDVSNVTNMSFMFSSAAAFNQPIGAWDVSSVTNMEAMFEHGTSGTYNFNQPLNSWNVSNVLNMRRMFRNSASSTSSPHNFNQPLSNWDVSNVIDMSLMFDSIGNQRYSRFNQDISMWQLNPAGVSLAGFMSDRFNQRSFSLENYSKLLAGWANSITANNGPFGISTTFGLRTYDDTDYFVGELYEDAVEGRAYLTNSNRLTVSSAGDPLADGDYLYSAVTQLYENTNDWYFIKTGGVWELRDNLDVVQATQQDVGDLDAPQLVTTWDGDLASATVLRTGAEWTIVDGGQAV